MLPLLLLTTLLPLPALAEAPPCDLGRAPPGLYVATISQGQQVHTQFGHTSLLVWDPADGGHSLLYDYGYFTLKYPDVVIDVLTANQRYFLSTRDLTRTKQKFRQRGQEVALQHLDLSDTDRIEITDALVAARAAEDPSFAYNWFEPNCSTKVRDVIDHALDGQLRAQHQAPSHTSVAREVERHTARSWFAWFGLHWGAGAVGHDRVSQWEAMFLPEVMQGVLRTSRIRDARGERPLVDHECVLVPIANDRAMAEAPWRDPWLAGIGLVAAAIVGGVGSRGRVAGALALGLTGLLLGVFGSLMLMIGVLGTFAPFWTHHNQVFGSPASLLLVLAGILHARRRGGPVVLAIVGGLTAVAALGTAWFAVRGFADHNAGIAAMVVPVLLACTWLAWRGRRDGTG